MVPVASVVVTGRVARRRFRDRFGGSPADRVARSGASVLVVDRLPLVAYRRPLIATALDDDLDRMTAEASELIASDVGLVLVHAVRIPFHGGRTVLRANRLEHELAATARDEMVSRLTAFGIDATGIEIVTRVGTPSAVVLAEIASRACDLVVLGAHRASTLPRLLRGSVTSRVLGAKNCDVLVVGRRS